MEINLRIIIFDFYLPRMTHSCSAGGAAERKGRARAVRQIIDENAAWAWALFLSLPPILGHQPLTSLFRPQIPVKPHIAAPFVKRNRPWRVEGVLRSENRKNETEQKRSPALSLTRRPVEVIATRLGKQLNQFELNQFVPTRGNRTVIKIPDCVCKKQCILHATTF